MNAYTVSRLSRSFSVIIGSYPIPCFVFVRVVGLSFGELIQDFALPLL